MFQARVLISKLRCQYHEAQILAPYLSIIMYFLNVDVIAPDQVASLPDKVLTRLGISPFCLPPTFHPSPLFSPLGSFAHLLLVPTFLHLFFRPGNSSWIENFHLLAAQTKGRVDYENHSCKDFHLYHFL